MERQCSECKRNFAAYPHPKWGTLPKTCPACRGKGGRYRRFVGGELLGRWEGVQVRNLPGQWEKYRSGRSGDADRYKVDVKGRVFGAAWSGRIVIWADWPVASGDIVDVEQRASTYRMCMRYVEESVTYPVGRLGSRTVTRTVRELVPVDEWPAEPLPDEYFMAEERHRFIVLRRSEVEEPAWVLDWATARFKTTLKGFGRQYSYTVVLPAPAVRLATISGSVRSGRAGGRGVLYLVPAGSDMATVRKD